jgi:succinate dehydrogenase/fumarate reductase flavoprotein subunit
MSNGTFGNPQIVEYKTEILIVVVGMAACGATYEAKRWAGDDVKVTLVDKAAVEGRRKYSALSQAITTISPAKRQRCQRTA